MTRSHGAFRKGSLVAFVLAAAVAACGWNPSKPFERESPQVRDAIKQYDAGAADAATALLTDYLTTGGCEEGNIGTPGRLRERPNGTFDLGLSLFEIAEAYGRRFGEEEEPEAPGQAPPSPGAAPNTKGLRAGSVECALRVVRAIADDPAQPASLRARAHYLEGNLLFLTAAYDEAVKAYDKALTIAPGMDDAGPAGSNNLAGRVKYDPDPVGRDAAWNRSIALRRNDEKKKDAGNDAAPNDGGGEGGDGQNKSDDPNDKKKDDADNKDSGKNDPPDAANNDGGGGDPKPKEEPPKEEDAGAPPPPSRQSQDERVLDRLENAPTVQQEAAKKQGRSRKVRGMADK